MRRHLNEAQVLLDEVAKDREQYAASLSDSTERNLWESYSGLWQQYADLHGEMLTLLQSQKAADATALVDAKGKRLYDDGRDNGGVSGGGERSESHGAARPFASTHDGAPERSAPSTPSAPARAERRSGARPWAQRPATR